MKCLFEYTRNLQVNFKKVEKYNYFALGELKN